MTRPPRDKTLVVLKKIRQETRIYTLLNAQFKNSPVLAQSYWICLMFVFQQLSFNLIYWFVVAFWFWFETRETSLECCLILFLFAKYILDHDTNSIMALFHFLLTLVSHCLLASMENYNYNSTMAACLFTNATIWRILLISYKALLYLCMYISTF